MASCDAKGPLIVHEDPRLAAQLERLAAGSRLVFFAGLPGTGKSLLIHQMAHLAHTAGREIHLLQWDVIRPRFEASRAGARHPMQHGVTHSVIRKAVGVWVRHALVAWQHRHPESRHLLIGETPLVGHRFIELARREDDAAEPLLAAGSCRFVIPVPSREVRRFLEAERDRRIHRPVHDREREDAPPHVLRALWGQLVNAGRALGVDPNGEPSATPPYDPGLYERVYRIVLRHRQAESLIVDRILFNEGLSVYEFAIPAHDVMPSAEETNHFIEDVERQYPDLSRLQLEMDRWHVV
jgi:hypothetical protein